MHWIRNSFIGDNVGVRGGMIESAKDVPSCIDLGM